MDLAREERAAPTDEEPEFGLRSLAVPVTDSRGHTVAAMSVSATAERVSMDQLREEFLPVVRDKPNSSGANSDPPGDRGVESRCRTT